MAITMDSDIVMLAKKTFQIGDGNKAIFETQEILRGPADVVDPAAASAMGEPEPVLRVSTCVAQLPVLS